MGISLDVQAKRDAAIERIRPLGSVVVALSGGVDSAVLLALALEALGPERVLSVTAESPSLPAGELDEARRIATRLGARHEAVRTHEMKRKGYRQNAGDRCFHCRTELFEVLGALARERGLAHVAYGAIRDDLGDFRPGMRAAAEHGAVAPLLEADLNKEDIRAIAGEAGLSVMDKPAGACLASRIPAGTAVTGPRLAQVDRAEAALRALGFHQLRVRHHGSVARLELDAEGLERLWQPGGRERVTRAVRDAGYRFVAVDLEGYRSGSLNPPQRTGPKREGGQ